MKLIEINIPEYTIDTKPNDKAIGKIVDDKLKRNFMNMSVLVRGIASSEHPDKTTDELINTIKKTGTDRYDPDRKGDRYENIEGKYIDLFAFPAVITPNRQIFHQVVWGFYHSSIAIHGYPMRIDIVSIYDASKMQQVLHQYKGRDDIKDDGYTFRNKDAKTDALMGIIKIN